ncbi:RING-type E3 ubiquitin transferase [Quillaja saponaria]|uniref:RING-type E3 ubiquitin transferase n=1 Tax=Quillaja saponaria TaxID=32244 RepID=A0AAD7LDQ6_QUISA|nr:RING-type E3 ubiquitin transferase [Quillaja saponaria]
MTQKFNRNDRRILNFPAVHPCEGISPTTLVSSLVTISQSICNFQSKFFATQKRNAKETIRQISNLLIFLEEIRDRGLIISNSIVLCFSELHLTFQKIQFLMEDCTLEGGRLLMLTKSQFVATQFRVLIRALATALDVLPLNLIEVCGEVKELVELVAKQARKSKFELDPDDELTMKRLQLVLNQFEKGIEPDWIAMRRILDYLEIRSWTDCNKEIKFLEGEIHFDFSDSDEREVQFLSNLLGFLSYSRGVIFETLDFRNAGDQFEARCSVEAVSCLNTEDFRCPISLELMTDPVTVSTGQTYDRSSIQKWLKAGNLTCPKTGEKLKNTELVPNSSLRKLIQQFCADNGISLAKSSARLSDITRTIVPGSAAAANAIQFLSESLSLKLCFGTNEKKNKAAYEIRLLTKSNIFNRSCLIEAGTIPPLINLVASTDSCTQANAISALLKLSKHTSGKKLIIDNGGLKPILKVLKSGLSLEAKQIAAATIFYLSSVKEYRKLIGENPDAIPALVEQIKEGTTCGKKNSVVAIFGLLLYPKNHQRVLAAGTVPLLIGILSSSDKAELLADSLAVLATLAENFDGVHAILQASALPVIIGIFKSSTSRSGKEYCVSILLSLCIKGGAEVVANLAKEPSLMTSLYSLLIDGTSLASKKARSVIKILQEFHETRTSGLMGSDVANERSVLHFR